MNNVLVEKIAACLIEQGKRVSCAESCTGGGVCYTLTSVPGSSRWFDEGYVSYSNESKVRVLGVSSFLVDQDGAVSESVALQMLDGILERSGADCGVSISGIAGPDGAMPGKPLGTICIAWGDAVKPKVMTYLFSGDRGAVREQAIQQALLNLYQYLK